MKEKIFCQKCEKRLIPKGLLAKGEIIYEFKDGYYCENCAKVKVEQARK